MVTMKIGIVQGRIIYSGGTLQKFPDKLWFKELSLAHDIGFDYIEWLADSSYNEENPVWSGKDLDEVFLGIKESGLTPYSICIDHIMSRPLTDDNVYKKESSYQDLVSIIQNAYSFGVKKFILPILESASVRKSERKISDLKLILLKIIKEMENKDVIFCLETDLSAQEHLMLLSNLPMNIGVCYDTGNRTFLGYTPKDEIPIMAERIFHVHVKDKSANGKNVMLGTGTVNFKETFSVLHGVGYSGSFTLETSRDTDEKRAAKTNLAFALEYLKASGF